MMIAVAALALGCMAPPASSQPAADETTGKIDAGPLDLELNNAVDAEGACRLSYVAVNRTGEPLEKISYDVVVFDKDQRVSRFLVLQFGRLAAGKTKVVQFDLADQPCTGISRILVNDVAECDGPQGSLARDTVPLCLERLEPRSRTDITFDT
ncbi:hypothetical protein [Jiella marina]|uniref:hypothetical protein n=1 Tax=Jiella sp. LLJ827 TaxID=2917712 RepID=UPI002100DB58|nr:hypothetical protein [Jiella sp. LLJ827]MCQ0990458.1 hypothetical protein [Jiella sp. LLJ827]